MIIRYTAPEHQLYELGDGPTPDWALEDVNKAILDPQDHKFSRYFDKANYVYVSAGKDGHGRLVHFCYSTNRNVAGFFLGWREVISDTKVKRDGWYARRVRNAAAQLAKRRAEAFKAIRKAAEEVAP